MKEITKSQIEELSEKISNLYPVGDPLYANKEFVAEVLDIMNC